MATSRDQNKGRRHSTKIGSRSVERKGEFKYLGTIITKQNSTLEEIKNRLNSWNACYHSVKNLLSSSLLFKNIRIKIHRNIILRGVCMGVKLGH